MSNRSSTLTIAMDKIRLGMSIQNLKEKVSVVKESVTAANAGEEPEGSVVLGLYVQSLEEVLTMLHAFTELLILDVDSYDRALIRFIEQDQQVGG